jgi:propanol-preferring alcohol dehydrogenase
MADIEVAPLLCAGIIGYRSLKLAEIGPGQRLGLFGFGASAHIALQVAVHWGCEVAVFTRSEQHRELALQLGAAWVGAAGDAPPELLQGSVTFAPVGSIVREALRVTAPGGTVAVNAIHMDEIPALDYREHLYAERTLRSVANFTRQDAAEFLELAPVVPLKTTVKEYALADANRALADMKASRVAAAAVLVP